MLNPEGSWLASYDGEAVEDCAAIFGVLQSQAIQIQLTLILVERACMRMYGKLKSHLRK